ncbi:hypothetical protein [Photobacterium nomapromontoriensis]|uniref:hypothetical protein n=1 Tax=Photobacterium nomapromontoriensis TaxID=2910237 RepID=UPI003D0CE207
MPQLITTIQNPDHGLYTMNMNGTDVRLLFTAKEIGGNIEIKGLSRPSRSPDGRYIITAYRPEAFQYNCVIFDLKTRQAHQLGPSRCHSFDWQADSQAVYFTGGQSWQQALRYDVTIGTATPLSPPPESELGELNYDTDFVSGWRSPDGKHLIRQLSYYAMLRVTDSKNQAVFTLPNMEYLGREAHYAKGCNKGLAFSADHSTFTCNTIGDTFSYYRFATPKVVAGIAPQRWIVQEGQWFMSEDSNDITRLRQPEEDSPLSAVRYTYTGKGKGPLDVIAGYFSMSISQNLRDDYNRRDFSAFFPPLPSPDMYWESAYRQLDAQSKGGERG